MRRQEFPAYPYSAPGRSIFSSVSGVGERVSATDDTQGGIDEDKSHISKCFM